MPDLTLNTFIDGTPADAASLSQNFYTPQVFNTPLPDAVSFELLNGWLERDNKEADTKVSREAIQPSALTEGRMVGGTLNQDYFKSLFPKFCNWENATQDIYPSEPEPADFDFEYQGTEGTEGSAEHDSFLTIPGASINFYNPYEKAFILFTWNIRWTHDGEAIMFGRLPGGVIPFNITETAQEDAAIRFFLKTPTNYGYVPGIGASADYSDALRRRVGQINIGLETHSQFPSKEVGGPGRFDYLRHREWSGHCALGVSRGENLINPSVPALGPLRYPGSNTGVSRGWYGGSLRIASGAKQARVQVRSMRYICFKLEDTPAG